MIKIITKIYNKIEEAPQEHMVFFATLFSIAVGVCSWQYCLGYFKAFGINIPYSHTDNILFVFDHFTKVTIGPFNNKYVSPILIVWGAPIFSGVIWIIKNIYTKHKEEFKFRPDDELRNDKFFQKLASQLNFFVFMTILGYLLSSTVKSYLAMILVLIFIVATIVGFTLDTWTGHTKSFHLRPIFVLLLILALTNGIFFLGRQEGKRIIDGNYRSLDTICLSLRQSNDGFTTCGKLIFSDSSRYCLKDDSSTYPICKKGDDYEATIIPSDL